MVQSVTHTEAEIQQMLNLLQDLESSMNNSKQKQETVGTVHKYTNHISMGKYMMIIVIHRRVTAFVF